MRNNLLINHFIILNNNYINYIFCKTLHKYSNIFYDTYHTGADYVEILTSKKNVKDLVFVESNYVDVPVLILYNRCLVNKHKGILIKKGDNLSKQIDSSGNFSQLELKINKDIQQDEIIEMEIDDIESFLSIINYIKTRG